MSAARPADDRPAPEATAAALAEAPFVRVLARADGDSLAAAGLLARALRERDIPFQVRTAPNPEVATDARDDDHTVAVGARVPAAESCLVGIDAGEPASVTAFTVARELGAEPDPVLGLAGVVAAGEHPGAAGSDTVLSAAKQHDLLRQRPGVAVPTADLGDGLAHSTLLHAPFSGDLEGTRAALAELDLPADIDDEAHRRVASLVAIAAVGDDAVTPHASQAIERTLRPHATPEAPFETVGGYADVLSAVAREAPGTGVALALGHGVGGETRTDALSAWREHALLVHTELRDATTGRYDGLFVARLDASASVGRLATAARLLRDFRSPEPVALVVADGAAAAAGVADGVDVPHLGEVAADAANALVADGDTDATGYGTRTSGEATFEADTSAFIAAFREGL